MSFWGFGRGPLRERRGEIAILGEDESDRAAFEFWNVRAVRSIICWRDSVCFRCRDFRREIWLFYGKISAVAIRFVFFNFIIYRVIIRIGTDYRRRV